MALIGDFLRAVGQLGDGRFLVVFLKSVGLTILLLLGLTFGLGWLASFLPTDLGEWWLIGHVEIPVEALQGLAMGAVLIGSVFLMIPVAAIFVGFFLEEIAEAVEARHYPHLPKARKMGFAETLGSALRLFGTIVLVNAIALVPYLLFLIFLPPLGVALAVGINGYLLGREYFELVAVRHMKAGEANRLRSRYFWRTWLAGVLMVIPLTIPIMNLLIPVLGVATVTHQFHRLRGATVQGSAEPVR